MKSLLIILLFFAHSIILSSQIFWSEDFANGIPNDWEIDEISNIGVSWKYCPDTTGYSTGIDNTCPFEWNDCDNGFQTHFKSETPENGYATCVLEPFIPQLFNNPFLVNLTTSPIDCSNRESVFLRFNSHIGLNSAIGDEDVFLRVSTDKVNWTTYFPHHLLIPFASTLPGIKRWSKNAEIIDIDISEVAAGEEEVYIQWRWTGNAEYHWSIDDVTLSTETSKPAVDISLSPNGPFHALMTNYKTPVSQIDTAYFITDIGNLGSQTQADIQVTARVIDSNNTILYSDTYDVFELEVDEIREDITFGPYLHQAGVGDFKITYEASSINEDARPDDNFFEYPFLITESEFAKNETTDKTINLWPRPNVQGILEPKWSIANHFYVPHGESFFLDSVQFEIPNPFEVPTGNGNIDFNAFDITLPIRLYEWENVDDFDFATQDEYNLIGFADFIITGPFGNTIVNVKLNPFNGSDANIQLKNNQHYFLAIDYIDESFNKLFTIKASTKLDYDATIRAHAQQGRQRFASMNRIGPTFVNSTYSTFSFGGDVIPHIGFTVTKDPGVSTDQVLILDGMTISPNPADKITQIKFELDIQENDKLELLDINGQLIRSMKLSQGQDQYNLDCSMLPNANYLLTYKSEKVISTTKLIVLH